MYNTSERGRSIKLGADAPSFVLKPKLEGDTLESHVTVDVITFCEKYFFKKFMRIIYYSIQSYGLKMLESQDVRTVTTLGKLRCSDILFSTYSKHQMLMWSEHQPALAENMPSFYVLKVKISWNASIFRPSFHCEV